jgi:hypothetical protein
MGTSGGAFDHNAIQKAGSSSLAGASEGSYPRRVHVRLLLLAAALVAAAPAVADPPPPLGIPDLVGARTLGMGATVAMPGGNDALWVNPAALAARRRYSVDATYFGDRRGADQVGNVYGGSVVDSLSGPVAAGFGYEKVLKGPDEGNLFQVGVGGPIADKLYLGLTGKYDALHPGTVPGKNTSAATLDVGAFWEPTSFLGIGAAGYNLVSIANPRVAPRMVAAGLSVGSDQGIRFSGEWRGDLDRAPKTTNRWALGAEALLGDLVPIRAGWVKDETLGESWWSAGIGVVVSSGAGIDAAYRQGIGDPSARTFAVSLKYFFSQF